MLKPMALSGVVALALATFIYSTPGEDPPAKQKSGKASDTKDSVMKKKLVQAHKILEGLALNDFSKLKSAADELAILRHQASWMVLKTRDYEVYSNDFQRQIEALQKAAKNKNIDGAALAYVDMTLTCVKCHQHVREEAIGLAPVKFDKTMLARLE